MCAACYQTGNQNGGGQARHMSLHRHPKQLNGPMLLFPWAFRPLGQLPRRAGFQQVERFDHVTNGGRHAFIKMARNTIEDPS